MPEPNANRTAFGRAVRQAREEQGLTQQTLAAACKLDRSYVSNIEKGKRNLSLTAIVKLASVLQTTAAELVAQMEAILRDEQHELAAKPRATSAEQPRTPAKPRAQAKPRASGKPRIPAKASTPAKPHTPTLAKPRAAKTKSG